MIKCPVCGDPARLTPRANIRKHRRNDNEVCPASGCTVDQARVQASLAKASASRAPSGGHGRGGGRQAPDGPSDGTPPRATPKGGPKPRPLNEIAAKISEYLRRFERDPTINRLDPKYETSPYWHAGAHVGGRVVRVTYVSYQGASSLDRARAEAYLAWLDAGNVGQHWAMERNQ